jgi:hypothetical protein
MKIKLNDTTSKRTTMKKHQTGPRILTSVILAVSGFALSAQATPTSISGDISLSGTISMNGSSFLTATAFTGFQDVSVGGPSAVTGDYVGTSGSAVTVKPFTWSPPTTSTPIDPLWTFVYNGDTYSFDLTVLHEDYASPTGLLLSGQGTAYITGPGTDFLPTSGTWDFSAQSQGQTSFTYSSTTLVPAVSVPDSSSTMTLMGASLVGLFIMGRKQQQIVGKIG